MDYDFEQLVEAFEYLDDLRESGAVNMFGASSYVAEDLGHDKRTARDLVSAWMKSYDGKTSAEDRAASFGETV
jgi:aryl-alcohol dehydrogenase-like predicted oxidoreductase